jgi:hypothetical protein
MRISAAGRASGRRERPGDEPATHAVAIGGTPARGGDAREPFAN